MRTAGGTCGTSGALVRGLCGVQLGAACMRVCVRSASDSHCLCGMITFNTTTHFPWFRLAAVHVYKQAAHAIRLAGARSWCSVQLGAACVRAYVCARRAFVCPWTQYVGSGANTHCAWGGCRVAAKACEMAGRQVDPKCARILHHGATVCLITLSATV